jgi:transcriptional regulator with XRE-family HTH domain
MRANEIIKARRLELQLSDEAVARRSGITIYEYGDLEQHADEFLSALSSSQIKKVCDCLTLDFIELIEHEVGTLSLTKDHKQSGPRNLLITKKRNALGISQSQLAESLGFEPSIVVEIEQDPTFLDRWPIELILALGKALDLSPRPLLQESG